MKTDVVIVGAGPVGLSLALGLARHGVRSVVLERDMSTSEYSKAPVIHIRTREVFRQWGIETRFLETGTLRRRLSLHSALQGRGPLGVLDFSDLENEADHPGLLMLEQAETERLLLDAVHETGQAEVLFGHEAIALTQGADRVAVQFRTSEGEQSVEAAFVIGCDGASSFVRGALGLPFDGSTYSVRPMIADVRIEDERDDLPWPRLWNASDGVTTAIRLRQGLWRIIRLERGDPAATEEVGRQEVADRVSESLGDGAFELVWASRFRIHRRASPRFRVGRVLLAGDAAHVHSPVGGLGMNGGIQDAHNLAWKLAAALAGGDLNRLLDSYDEERRTVIVGTVSSYTDFLTRTFLDSPAGFRAAAFKMLGLLVRSARLRRLMLRRTAMMDLSYQNSPLLPTRDQATGRRLPNTRLRTADGRQLRLYDLLPNGPAMIELNDRSGDLPMDLPGTERVRIGAGAYQELDGLLAALLDCDDGVILVRPDTHIAWAGSRRNVTAGLVRAVLGRS